MIPNASTPPAPHTMTCMEVWGGHGISNNGVTMPGLDVWVFSIPYAGDELGGDVHYVSSCGTGRISRLLVADVSGHGVKVADVASSLRSLMRRFVNYIDQRTFVERMNAEFAALAKAGMFATAAVATYFAPTGTLSITNAGHPRPLLYSAKRRAWRLMNEDPAERAPSSGGKAGESTTFSNLPLGMFAETVYPAVDLRARPGDLCIIYSDSLLEAKTADGRMLGQDGLLALLSTLDASRPDTLPQALYNKVLAAAPGLNALNDDVTILVLRPNGLQVSAPIGQRLAAQIKFLGLAARSLFGGPAAPWPQASKGNILGAMCPPMNKHIGRDAPEI